MAQEPGTRIEAFDTEAEANAFISGVEYADNDHITTEPAYEDAKGKWLVEVTEFC